MKIKWYGTASLLIEGGNTRILIDPYLKKYNKKLPRVPVEEAASAQAAFITHPHLDHFPDIGAFLEAGLPAVYVSQNGIDRAARNGIPTEKMIPIAAGEEITVGEISVKIYQSRHCVFDAATVLGVIFHPMTYFRVNVSVALLKDIRKFKIGDDIFALELTHGGKKIMVLGSAGMDQNTVYPTGADLLVFPYQGRSKMHKYMLPFLEAFRPKAVMADHFDNAFPPFTHTINMKKFVPAVQDKLPGCAAFVPKEGEWYEI